MLRFLSFPAGIVVGVIGVLAVGGALVWLATRHGQELPDLPGPRQVGGFREAATESGITWRMNFLPNEQGETFKINLYDHGSGVAVADYDGDGHDDIYLCNELGKNVLYHNKGDGTFEDVTADAGVGFGDRICTGATWADIDNSGLPCLFVTSTRGGNVLFKNLGNGKFKDVTREAGLTHVGHSQIGIFFDYDNDGYLDLLVLNTAEWTTNKFDPRQRYFIGKGDTIQAPVTSHVEENILYHNNGDGTFTNVTKQAGLAGKGWSGDVAVLDYDGDGYLDLLVTNMFGRSTLYHNSGNGTFTDVTKQTLGKTSFGAVGCKAFDFNNDGLLDLFIVDMHSDMWMSLQFDWRPNGINRISENEKTKWPRLTGPEPDPLTGMLPNPKYADVIFGNTFFKNLGGGKFREMSDRANLETLWPWGIAAGDFDNDGYIDLFIPSGMGYPFFYWPNYLMMNNGNETFTDRAREQGIEPPPGRGEYAEQLIAGRKAARSSRAAAVADFDGDGRLDLIVNNFNDQPYYFRNQFPKKNYIAFRLRGGRSKLDPKGSNRDAIGALVKIFVGKEVMVRQVDPAGGYLAQSSKTVHFGLGDRRQVDRVEIRWPSGRKQVIDKPEINRLHDRVEPPG
jgi:hypothetical protein